MRIDHFSFTSPGGRNYNEDAVGAKALEGGGLYALADGLGGHRHGELASACVIDSVLGSFSQEEAPEEALPLALARANTAVMQLQEESHGKMKSTAVCLLIREDRGYWAHVGDSRLYYIHDGQIAAFTADHSVAYKKYLSGEIRRSQIPTDEDQSSLLRALGNPTRNQCDSGSTQEPLKAGDGFLLCSDGLWEYLHDQEILVDLLKSETAQQWAQLLLLRVMERAAPGNDNLSLITVRIYD